MIFVYYRKCPKCGAAFQWRLRPDALRVGEEVSVCICGEQYWSGKREWVHFSKSQKFFYFCSEGAVGIILMLPLMGLLVVGHWAGAVLLPIFPLGVLWWFKLEKVRESRKRCPNP